MKKVVKKIEFSGREISITHGEFAQQAAGSVVARLGDTVVFAAVSVGEESDRGYFPLSVEYQERLYAGGKIKGSRWVKRDGRPSDNEILNARLIDRSIRPLFPAGFKNDVQVVVTVLSVDLENNPADIAPIAVSAAVDVSPLPWKGPVSVVRVGEVEGEFVLNPTEAQMQNSSMDMIVSSTKDSVVMIEAGANEVPEEKVLEGIDFAHAKSKDIIEMIKDLTSEVGQEKMPFSKPEPSADLEAQVKKLVGDRLEPLVKKMAVKEDGFAEFKQMKKAVSEEFEDEAELAGEVVENMLKKQVRKMILSGKRPDGRGSKDIRDLESRVSVLPRTHGSGLFRRGSTQVLSVVTLGPPSLGQLLESAEGEEEKHYIHHYEMPPYATGETGRIGSPNRREIGHGALAERALLPVIPSQEDFPYTILVKSEVFSSNGSSSMASTCGSTLSLMDAGVPIKAPVSGIAMGIVIESKEKYAILTDIIGMEDFNGDMDFKVTGTTEGITAMQMDVKTLLLTPKILKEALNQAKQARQAVLENMLQAIDGPRKEVSALAPKITTITVEPDKIGTIIGPGGKTIKSLAAETGAEIDVEDDGTVNISGIDAEGVQKAIDTIKLLVKEVDPGEIYEGEVKRIENFGAFVEILPGKEGLVHISDMSDDFVKDANDIVSIGDKIQVRVKEIDKMGRINLSMNMDPASDEKKDRGGNDGGRRGGGRGVYKPRNDRNSNRGRGGYKSGNNKKSSGGPHFPASRLVASDKNKRRR